MLRVHAAFFNRCLNQQNVLGSLDNVGKESWAMYDVIMKYFSSIHADSSHCFCPHFAFNVCYNTESTLNTSSVSRQRHLSRTNHQTHVLIRFNGQNGWQLNPWKQHATINIPPQDKMLSPSTIELRLYICHFKTSRCF